MFLAKRFNQSHGELYIIASYRIVACRPYETEDGARDDYANGPRTDSKTAGTPLQKHQEQVSWLMKPAPGDFIETSGRSVPAVSE